MKLTAFLLLIPAIAAYSISQLAQHKKLICQKHDFSFWGEKSYMRKYKLLYGTAYIESPDNWYYRLFKIAHRERWFTSTNLTVAFTDGYHMCQAGFFLFLSLSITFAIGFDRWLLAGVWSGAHIIHAGVYKLLQK